MSENAMIQQEQEMQVMSVPQSTAVNVWQDKEAFEQVSRVAGMLSRSTIVPENYRGKPEDCFIAVEMASRMNTSPIFIMQNLYVVKGKPSWAGQACMAMIMSCGKFRNVHHVYTGQKGTDTRGCYVEAERVSNGEKLTGTEVTMAMVRAEGWISNSKWKTMPEQMLGYRAASFFARMYCPEAMMGLQTTDEIYDAAVPVGARPAQNLAAAIQAEEAEPNAEPKPEPEKKKAAKKEKPVHICEVCGKEITGTAKYAAGLIAEGSKQKYGKCMCMECAQKAKQDAERAAYQAAMEQPEAQDDLAAQIQAAAEE